MNQIMHHLNTIHGYSMLIVNRKEFVILLSYIEDWIENKSSNSYLKYEWL